MEKKTKPSSDDDASLAVVAKLVDALAVSIPKGSENAERKKEALDLGRELLRGAKYET